MIDQHTKAHDRLRQIAQASGVTLPASLDGKHQRIQEKLQKLNGAAFDHEYMKAMVDAHQDTEKLLRTRTGDAASDRRSNIGSSAGTGAGTSSTATGASGTASTAGTSGTSTSTTGITGAPTGTSGSSVSGTGAGSNATGTSASAGSIENYAATTLPEVQHHLQIAKDLEKRVKGERQNKNDR
jgi:predicted outer membrane protein